MDRFGDAAHLFPAGGAIDIVYATVLDGTALDTVHFARVGSVADGEVVVQG